MNQTGMFVTVYAVILKITTLLLDGVYSCFMCNRALWSVKNFQIDDL